MNLAPTTKLTVLIKSPNPELNQIYEGAIPKEDMDQWNLMQIVGDGKSEVVVGVDAAAKDFGQGGGVFVSVKLTCNQSSEMIDYAAKAAASIAQKHLWEQFASHQTYLRNMGLIK